MKSNEKKTKEELDSLKAEVERMNQKLAELSPEELEQVCGGETWWLCDLVMSGLQQEKAPELR